MASRLIGTTPFSEPMLISYQVDSQEQTSVKLESKHTILFVKIQLKMSVKWRPLCPRRDELRLYNVLGILPHLTATVKQNCSQTLSTYRENIEESVNACLVYYVKSVSTILTSLIFFAIYRVLVRQLIQNSSYHNQIRSTNIISRCCHAVCGSVSKVPVPSYSATCN